MRRPLPVLKQSSSRRCLHQRPRNRTIDHREGHRTISWAYCSPTVDHVDKLSPIWSMGGVGPEIWKSSTTWRRMVSERQLCWNNSYDTRIVSYGGAEPPIHPIAKTLGLSETLNKTHRAVWGRTSYLMALGSSSYEGAGLPIHPIAKTLGQAKHSDKRVTRRFFDVRSYTTVGSPNI